MTEIDKTLDAGNAPENLEEALRAAAENVKARTQDKTARLRLIDLLIAKGDFERADKQADILSSMDPSTSVGMALLRGRIRAADARRAWFESGATPYFPEGPTPLDKIAIGAALERRSAAAGQSVASPAAYDGAPAVINGARTAIFRDIDDRVPHAFEALSTDGSYLWLDFAALAKVQFEPVTQFRDLVWRKARVATRGGSISDLVFPATYYADGADDAHKLGRKTEWTPLGQNLYAGVGQKCFLADDRMIGILEISTIDFG